MKPKRAKKIILRVQLRFKQCHQDVLTNLFMASRNLPVFIKYRLTLRIQCTLLLFFSAIYCSFPVLLRHHVSPISIFLILYIILPPKYCLFYVIVRQCLCESFLTQTQLSFQFFFSLLFSTSANLLLLTKKKQQALNNDEVDETLNINVDLPFLKIIQQIFFIGVLPYKAISNTTQLDFLRPPVEDDKR